MALRQDKVQLIVEINGKKAGGSLNKLKGQAKALHKALGDATDPKEAERLGKELGKVRGAIKSVYETTRQAKVETSAWQKTMRTFGPLIAATFSISAVKGFFNWISSSNTALNDMEKKFKTVFEDSSSLVSAWADKVANSLGLTRAEYKRTAAEMGDLLKPMGFQAESAANISKELIELSAAQAVWSQGKFTAKETSEIMTKALLGEREQLKSLGIAINEADVKQRLQAKGADKYTGAALKQAKAIATLELITESSTDAITAFNAEEKSSAQKIEIVKAKLREKADTIATKLLPAYNAFIGLLEKGATFLLTFIDALLLAPKFFKENRVSIYALAAAILALNANLIRAKASTLASIAVTKLQALWTKRSALSFKGLNAVMRANPIGFIVSIISVLVIAMEQLYKRSETVRYGIAGLGAVAKEIFTIIKESFAGLADGFSKLLEGDFKGALKSVGNSLSAFNPVSLAVTQGERLKAAFNKGWEKKEFDESQSIEDELAKANELAIPTAAAAGEALGNSYWDGVAKANEENVEETAKDVVEKLPKVVAPATIGSLQTKGVSRERDDVKFDTDGVIKALDEELDIILHADQKAFLQRLISEEQYQENRLNKIASAKERELELLRTYGLQETEQYRKIELEKLQAQKDLHDKQLENEQRHKEMKAQIQKEGLATFNNVLDAGIELLGKDEEARRKNASAIKAFEVAKILASLPVEIAGYFKSFSGFGPIGTALAIAQSAVATARAYRGISQVKSQSFWVGGRTGPGMYRDSSGHRVAGVVHDNEYVMPKWMTDSDRGRHFIDNFLEPARLRGSFEVGGWSSANTTPNYTAADNIQTTKLDSSRMEQVIGHLAAHMRDSLSNIQAELSFTDFELKTKMVEDVRDLSKL